MVAKSLAGYLRILIDVTVHIGRLFVTMCWYVKFVFVCKCMWTCVFDMWVFAPWVHEVYVGSGCESFAQYLKRTLSYPSQSTFPEINGSLGLIEGQITSTFHVSNLFCHPTIHHQHLIWKSTSKPKRRGGQSLSEVIPLKNCNDIRFWQNLMKSSCDVIMTSWVKQMGQTKIASAFGVLSNRLTPS